MKRPMTCDAVEAATGWPHQTVSARINELHEKFKCIVDSGLRDRTRHKRWAVVWRVVDETHPWHPLERNARVDPAYRRVAESARELLSALKRDELWLMNTDHEAVVRLEEALRGLRA